MKKYEHLMATDPDFIQRYEAFAMDEVINEPGQVLEAEMRYLTILAALIGCQGLEVYKNVLEEALEGDFSPVMAKEIVYQAVAYLGFGRVYPFLEGTNTVLGIQLPLESQSTTTMATRLERGVEVQMAIFGPGMKAFWRGGHVNRWLAANCFGDYYTRTGLSLKQRELITFCFLAAQGGCEAQLSSHVTGNLNLGNDKALLLAVISQCVPYIGYPRSLNAISVIQKVTADTANAK
jgi:4-carboxymuconolactone decarboxylase